MENIILLAAFQGRNCAALIEGKCLKEIITADSGADNIYVGRIETVLPGMQAAFVNIGLDKNAFLPAEDVPDKAMLKPGAELPVQTVKVPGGTKGVRVSGYISLPGRMSVLMPFSNGVGVSKRITDTAENTRLRSVAEKLCPEGMGIVVRTNAAGSQEGELENDVRELLAVWEGLSKRLNHIKAPKLIHSPQNIAENAARELISPETVRIIADGQELYDSALEAVARVYPGFRGKIELHKSDVPLFGVYNVESQLDKALSRKVWLESGGYLVIDCTEALTVIDVNSGKFTGSRNLSDTAFRLNCEAANEIAHQLRLRDIGGIIIIDFVDMNTQKQKDQLLDVLKAALGQDRSHTNVVDITPLGLVEMTRKRKREKLSDVFRFEDK